MWLLSQMSPDGAALSLVMALRLRGRLNLAALRQALADIVRRHEVLGSVIAMRDGVLVQRPGANAGLRCPVVELAGLPAPDAAAAADRLLRAAGQQRFDLAAGPVIRACVLRLGPDHHLVALAMHHVVTDGWSVNLLAREVSAVYQSFRLGRPGPLAGRPAMQYAEFARAQRSLGHDEAVERCAARLAGLPAARLPGDRPRQATAPGPAAFWRGALPPSVAAALGELRRRDGGSVFMLVLAALLTVMHRMEGRDEVSVGTLAAGRTRPELEGMLGYFGNLLVIGARFDGDPTFRDVWRQVRDDCIAAYADQDVPYEMARERLAAGMRGRAPDVRVLCVMQQEDPAVALPGLEAEPVDVPAEVALFDLTVEIRLRAGALQLALQYDADLFDHATIAALGRYLRAVLACAAADPDVRCSTIPLPGTAPTGTTPPAIPRDHRAPAAAPTVHGLFEAQAIRTPDAIALRHGGRAVSFSRLNAQANLLAGRLIALGAGPESVVGVLMERSIETVTALLAVLKSGAAYLPLDPSYPPQRVQDLVTDSGASLVITTAALAGRLAAGPLPSGTRMLIIEEQIAAARGHAANPTVRMSASNLACVIFTSGSTGRPMGVLLPHRALVNRLRWMWRAYPFAPGERAVHKTALSFVDSLWEIFGPLLQGVPAQIVAAEAVSDPHRLAAALASAGASRIVAVPSLLRALLDAEPGLAGTLPALRTWVSSGEPLTADLAARFHAALPGRLLLNLYGSTEVTADVTAAEVPAGAPQVLIGLPIDGAAVRLADPGGATVPPFIAGELLVSGIAVTRGYHRAAATAAKFLPDAAGPPGSRCFRTGDRARARAGGALEFLGRLDDQIQVRGSRVEPAEVEAALLRHPRVSQAAVTGQPDRAGTTVLAGYIVPDEPCTHEEIRGFLNGHLPPHLIPSALVFTGELPRTASGKIDRARLPQVTELPAAGGAAQPPGTPAEQAVADAFAALLPVRWRGRHDDFFALGGHSLLAVALLDRLRRHGLELSLSDLFAEPTIAGLASRASRPAGPVPGTGPVPRPQDWYEPFPLTDVQAAYWVGRDPGLALGNIATHSYFELDAPALDPGRLTAAVRQLVQRHHALRTVLRPDGTQQVLRTVPDYQIRVTDLRTATAGEREARLMQVRQTMSHQILPADRWPLFDIGVCLLPDSAARICVSLDALIADAYSVQILLRELGQLYQDPAARLAPLRISFRDHVLAESAGRQSPEYQRALEYWRRRLPALPPGPRLPLATSVAQIGSPRFRRWSRTLPAAQWRQIKDRAARAGLTPTAVLLAAFCEVLTAWSADPRYSVTLTLFNRPASHPDLARVVGDFTSLTLLEVDHTRPAAFLARARAVQEQMWADLDRRAVSGVTVTREWAWLHDRPLDLVTPVVFTSNLGLPTDPAGPAAPALGRLGFSVSQTPQLYLDHQVSETAEGLLLNWDAVAELFPAGLIDDALQAYAGLLSRLAAAAPAWEQPAAALLPPAQQARRTRVNATSRDLPARCLHEIVAEGGACHPDTAAVITTGQRLSHAEVLRRAGRVAHRLRDLGARRGELVGVAMHTGWEQVVAVIGVAASGAAYVPLDPELPASRMRHLAASTGLRHVLTQSWLAGRMAGLEETRQLAVDDDAQWRDYPTLLPPAAAGPHDLAYVIFTSGSSGSPKGVMIEHGAAVNTILDVNRRFGVGPRDRVLGVSALSFDLSVYDIFGLLAAGGAVVLPDQHRRRDPGHWLELSGRAGVSIWNSVPALLALLADCAERRTAGGLESLRLALLSGDWIPLDLPGRISKLTAAAVVSLGGATEASIWSVLFPVDSVDPRWTAIPYGRPLANQQLHVLDRSLAPRPDWVPGDLYIEGDALARGYWRDPARTAAAFRAGPGTGRRIYRTGDRARYLPDGTLEFLGREDLQVKISGFRVEIGEAEAALGGVAGVAACAVTAVGPRGEQRLVAFYVPEKAAGLSADRIRAQLRAVLPGYLIPGTFVALESLPLTRNGKIDRAALARQASTRPPQGAAAPDGSGSLVAALGGGNSLAAAPGGDSSLIADLSGIWAHVLGADRVGPHDNFFALGGTSLVGIRLLGRLEAAYGVKIPLIQLYEEPTVTGLAAAITSVGADQGALPEAPPADGAVMPDIAAWHDPFPLTEVQEAYWLGRRTALPLGGVATHSYVEFDVRGLDLGRLDAAVAQLVERHPALRTVVLPDGRQQVLAGVPAYRIGRTDMRRRPPAERQAELHRVRESMSHQVHPADRWPLFEIQATLLDDSLTRLHVGIDLLVADALSFRILQRDLLACYQGRAADLPPLRIAFRDYIVATQRLRAGPRYQEAEQYWRGRAPSLPRGPSLPMLRELTEVSRPRFHRLAGQLDEAGWAALRRAAGTRNLTPSGLLCAAFAEVLAAWSQCGRFTLNLTTFNRGPLHPDVNDLVGDFTSTTLLAVDATAGTFAERSAQLQRQIFTDLEHRDFSGIDVLRLLRTDPHRRAAALAPIVFTSTIAPGAEPTAIVPGGWDAEPVFAISQTPQVLLDHQVHEFRDELIYTWDHVADMFPPGMIEAMFAAYGRLLQSLIHDDTYWKARPAWTS
jgi:nonribosomal peptide synthetase protein BlmIV